MKKYLLSELRRENGSFKKEIGICFREIEQLKEEFGLQYMDRRTPLEFFQANKDFPEVIKKITEDF